MNMLNMMPHTLNLQFWACRLIMLSEKCVHIQIICMQFQEVGMQMH